MTSSESEALARGWWPTEVVDERGRVMWARPDRPGLFVCDEALEVQPRVTAAPLSAAA